MNHSSEDSSTTQQWVNANLAKDTELLTSVADTFRDKLPEGYVLFYGTKSVMVDDAFGNAIATCIPKDNQMLLHQHAETKEYCEKMRLLALLLGYTVVESA